MTSHNERYLRGLAVRRQVLGEDHVDRQLQNSDKFTADLQDYLAEHCWGVVWTRSGLDLRTRSLITLAILAATDKQDEIKLHTAGALRNGCTPEDIKEVFLHTAVYAGAPSAVAAFRSASPVIAEQAAST
jgi:4-carboxymuconolactone decarboxylase